MPYLWPVLLFLVKVQALHYINNGKDYFIDPLEDSAKITSCYSITQTTASQYVLGQVIHKICLPSIVVAGFPKSGSSAIFHLIGTHPDAVSTTKEICFSKLSMDDKYFKELVETRETLGPKHLASACMQRSRNMEEHLTFKPQNRKYIFVVRNHAERFP